MFWLVKQIKRTMGVFAYNGFEVVIIIIGIRGKNSLCVHDYMRRNFYTIIRRKKEGGLKSMSLIILFCSQNIKECKNSGH